MFNDQQAIRILDLSRNRMPIQALTGATVIALGNFDGVHCAHRALLAAATRRAKITGTHSAVFCFDPPSSDYLTNLQRKHLSTIDEKLSLFAECGIEYAILASFPAFRQVSPKNFIEQILKAECRAQSVVCGFNYRFGQFGAGTTDTLIEHFGTDNVSVVHPHCVSIEGRETLVSSSVTRNLLSIGEVAVAARLLGQPYCFTAAVTRGKQLGQKLGFPTINQTPPQEKILPAPGVYITRAWIDGKWVGGVSNVGCRPTVERNAVENCETHLIDFNRDLYDQTITVEFLERLRGESRFHSISELQAAVARDIETARAYFQS